MIFPKILKSENKLFNILLLIELIFILLKTTLNFSFSIFHLLMYFSNNFFVLFNSIKFASDKKII